VELPAAPRLGSLRVETTPPGADVLLDGTARGKTPLDLAGVEPGEHEVTLMGGGGRHTERVTVTAGGTSSLVVPLETADPIQAGWLTVVSPVELQLLEDGRLVGSSRMERVMLRAGEHRLRLVNAPLGFESEAAVRVRAGEVTRHEVVVPHGTVSVNAVPWAEVFLDGRRVGETPLANLPTPIGPHDLVLRHPKYPDQRRSVTVSLKDPVRIGVDMRQ
jgi:hypothetical protein